jgi:two-component system chemotaxis response regulator CheY
MSLRTEPYRILVVDDSPFIHKAVQKALVPAGYEICGTGRNGKEAVAAYGDLKPDLLIMDITMPIMDGITAAREITIEFPEAVIMLLSAMGDEEIRGQAQESGVKSFATKPFTNQELVVEVQKLLCPRS